MNIAGYITFIHTRTVLYIFNGLHCVIAPMHTTYVAYNTYVDNNDIIVRQKISMTSVN